MASANHTSVDERVFSRAQLNLNLPLIVSPHNASLAELHSVTEEIERQKYYIYTSLLHFKTVFFAKGPIVCFYRIDVLCSLKHEDNKDRHSCFTQLEHLAHQMRELPLPIESVQLLNKSMGFSSSNLF